MNYAKLAFTDAIQAVQKKYGSRESYQRMEQFSSTEGLSPREVKIIKERDSFYVASSGENGFPYVQHRGGPKGFLKVIDSTTLGFLDFTGNKQYITVGNLANNNKVALILVDYPNRARLKIYAKAEIKELNEVPELVEWLKLDNYKYRPERIILYHIKAFDWNCPQHITPRYTVEEIEEEFESQKEYIATLEAEIKSLRDNEKSR